MPIPFSTATRDLFAFEDDNDLRKKKKTKQSKRVEPNSQTKSKRKRKKRKKPTTQEPEQTDISKPASTLKEVEKKVDASNLEMKRDPSPQPVEKDAPVQDADSDFTTVLNRKSKRKR